MSCSLKKWVFGSGGWTKQYRFLITSGCLLSRKVWWAVRSSNFWRKIEVFYRPEWTKVMNLKMNFKHFQIQKCYKQIQQRKSRWKNGAICVVSMFPSWVVILKLSKKVHFFNFVLTSAKKSNYVKAIYIYASERSCYALSENVVYYAVT